MFTDRLKVKLIAGKGGNGVVAWRREKYIPKGGPTGGNGGRGGSIILRTSPSHFSLEGYRSRRILKAENGQGGGPERQRGRKGQDRIIDVPCGTLVKDPVTGHVLRDLTEPGEEWVICNGGFGGRGNAAFKTSTNRAPGKCTNGMPGQEAEVELELKLIADVGLVGFPNAGKSTLIQEIAEIPVKIAPYPFTTLRPNLGYIEFEDYTRMLIADIPGIIAGAHENRGLGFEFLRHIERCKVLVYLLDASGVDGRTPLDDYRVLRQELGAYDPELLDRPSVVVLNKIDTEEAAENVAAFKQEVDETLEISALKGDGLDALTESLYKLCNCGGRLAPPDRPAPRAV